MVLCERVRYETLASYALSSKRLAAAVGLDEHPGKCYGGFAQHLLGI
jgi:hypothetical protein